MKIKPKHKKILADYLLWRCDNQFRPPVVLYDINSLSPEQIMMEWESQGIPIPTTCTDPELLADYIQGKSYRDWHITEWRNAVKELIALPYEFIGSLGCTEDNYQSIFAGLCTIEQLTLFVEKRSYV